MSRHWAGIESSKKPKEFVCVALEDFDAEFELANLCKSSPFWHAEKFPLNLKRFHGILNEMLLSHLKSPGQWARC